MEKSYNIAVLAGDGIGMEVMPEGIKALQSAQKVLGTFDLKFENFDWEIEYYQKTGRMMPVDGLKTLEKWVTQFAPISSKLAARRKNQT